MYDQNVALKSSCIHSPSKYTPFLLCIRKSRVQVPELVGIILSENFYRSQGKSWEHLHAVPYTAGSCTICWHFYLTYSHLKRTKWSVFISVINKLDVRNFCFAVRFFMPLNYSYCLGSKLACLLAPQTVWSVPEAATTVLCTADDGRDGRPKHVE